MNEPKLEEINKIAILGSLQSMDLLPMENNTPGEAWIVDCIVWVWDSVTWSPIGSLEDFEHRQNQQRLASQIKHAIDVSLNNELHGLVEPEHISDISKDVQWGLYRVLEGGKDSTGYHVILNTGNEQYKKSDLIPGILTSAFETINS